MLPMPAQARTLTTLPGTQAQSQYDKEDERVPKGADNRVTGRW